MGTSKGSAGQNVRDIQNALISAGISVRGGADGDFGSVTQRAVEEFQRRRGLPATGTVGWRTAVALGIVEIPRLARGDQGGAVFALQDSLLVAGAYIPGGSNGSFDAATEKDVLDFQRWNGLSQTGSVDVATSRMLALAVSTRSPSVTTSDDSGSDDSGSDDSSGDSGNDSGGGSDEPVDPDPVEPDTSEPDDESGGDGQPAGLVMSEPFLGASRGDRGDHIRVLQQVLVDGGAYLGTAPNGVFGPATERALRQFQRWNSVEQSGVVTRSTVQFMFMIYNPPWEQDDDSSDNDATDDPYDHDHDHDHSGDGEDTVIAELGDRGDTVKAVQQALIKAGVTVRGGADGVFGPVTKAAVETFQREVSLTITGVVDTATSNALGLGDDPRTGVRTVLGYAVFGERGTRVVALQRALMARGIAVRGGADGLFGGATSTAVMDFQRANGLTVSGRVDDATGRALGLTPAEPPGTDSTGVQIDVFPMQGRCAFGDTWHAPRGGGRLHVGVDIIGAEGKLLYAVADGEITKIWWDWPGSSPGNGIRLTTDDGTYFVYLHLQGFADGITVGSKVKAGQIIGYNGNTGSSSTAHLHFEVHPQGGAPINPYPMMKAIDACEVTTPLPQPD